MANNIGIKDAADATVVTRSTDASGVHSPHSVVEFSSGGVPTPVSSSAPLPVDTELPAATVPSDADANSAVPSVAGRGMVLNAQTGQWVRARMGRVDGGGLPSGVAAVAPHCYNAHSGQYDPAKSAANTGDSESGPTFGPVANMVWDGSFWTRQRALAPRLEVALASDARTADTSSPSLVNVSSRGVLVALNVTVAGTGTLALRVFANLSGFITLLGVTGLSGTGSHVGIVCPGASLAGIAGPDARIKGVSAVALPRLWGITVAPSDSSSWTYSVSYSLLP
ncbi:MAG: hypothetical protein M0P31_13735 [Solirubrobacteraceae bacterium]|nr:hypothetical protein [Solirubrobacteraceae bacterium]